jgi:uncharacterized protein
MNYPLLQQPLTKIEFDRLAEFLDNVGPSALNLESLDGYFAALICGPDLVPANEYLPQVWGEDHSFASDEQAADIVGLIIRHWNTINRALRRSLEVPDGYIPLLLEADDGIAHGNDWALGFMRGMQARPRSWDELIELNKDDGPMLPIMILAHEHDPDPAMRPKPVPAERREILLQWLVVSLSKIYRHFEPQRRTRAQSPRRF